MDDGQNVQVEVVFTRVRQVKVIDTGAECVRVTDAAEPSDIGRLGARLHEGAFSGSSFEIVFLINPQVDCFCDGASSLIRQRPPQ